MSLLYFLCTFSSPCNRFCSNYKTIKYTIKQKLNMAIKFVQLQLYYKDSKLQRASLDTIILHKQYFELILFIPQCVWTCTDFSSTRFMQQYHLFSLSFALLVSNVIIACVSACLISRAVLFFCTNKVSWPSSQLILGRRACWDEDSMCALLLCCYVSCFCLCWCAIWCF